jgi:hypothetical protein
LFSCHLTTSKIKSVDWEKLLILQCLKKNAMIDKSAVL